MTSSNSGHGEGTVIWVTGLSGAGKTTLCVALEHLAKPRIPEFFRIDGDVVRDLFGQGLGYTEPERVVQINRLQALAGMLAEQGLVVAVAALYAHPDLLAWNRQNLPGYFEVYLDAPLQLVQQRDSKGLYSAAAESPSPQMVGLDIPWHAPPQPDLTIDATLGESADTLARKLAASVPGLAARLEEGHQ
jgi:adenylylsulfate kinase-like enzyme